MDADAELTGRPLAAIGQRVAARFLDWVLIFLLWLGLMGPMAERTAGGGISVPFWVRLVALGILIAYEVGFVASSGQTLGKRIVGIRVQLLREDRLPGLGSAVLRVLPVIAVVVIGGQFFAVVLVVLYFTAGFASDRRGLIDRLAGTVVVVSPSADLRRSGR